MKLNDHDQKMLLALQEGKLKTGELARVLGVTPRTVQKRAVHLMELGLIEKPHQGVRRLTARGRSLVEEKLLSVEVDLGKLQPLIEALPAAALQAFTRLLLSALIAKAHLFDLYETSWPSFVVGGPTKTGKTLIAYMIGRLLRKEGLIKHVQTATAGELIGRRFQGKEGWNFDPSPYFSGPFICLDELDKAQGELQRQALYYLQGDRTITIEGGKVEVRPVALVTLNTDIKRGLTQVIPEPYLRRAVVLNTEPIRGELGDIDMAARRLLKPSIRLDPVKLPPSAERLSDRELMLLRRLLKENVTGEGWGLLDPPSIAILALGRSALVGDVGEAIYQTVWDRLMCAETLCHTRQGWRARIAEEWRVHREREAPEVQVEIPEPKEPEIIQERVRDVKEDRRRELKERGEFIERRSQLAQGFLILRDRLMEIRGGDNKRMTKPLRDKLDYYSKWATKLPFGDLEQLERGEGLLPDLKGEVDQLYEKYRQAVSQGEARAAEARQLRVEIKSLKQEAAAFLKLHQRKRTRANENVIEELLHLECVSWQWETYKYLGEDPTEMVVVRIVEPPPLVPKLRWMEGLRFYLLGCDGRRYSSEELERWENPKTKQLLEAKLKSIAERLKDLEDRLQELGTQGPPQLPAGDFTL